MDQILKFSEAANLAIHALTYMASVDAKASFSASTIAHDLKVSESHLSKVMQRLVKKHLVRSIRGAKGGFILEQKPKKVTLLEILEAIDGHISPRACMLGKPICGEKVCKLKGLTDDVVKLVRRRLSGVTLSEFKIRKISGFKTGNLNIRRK